MSTLGDEWRRLVAKAAQIVTLSIVGISGNVKRPSRTAALVDAIVTSIVAKTEASIRRIELVDAAPPLFATLTPDRLSGEAREIVDAVESADILVVGTPVYRASYTGALKHLFDLVHFEALAGKPVILAATGGSALHGLVTEDQLRPLLSFFGALTVPTAVYAIEADFHDYAIVNPAIVARIERASAEALRLPLANRAKASVATARAAANG